MYGNIISVAFKWRSQSLSCDARQYSMMMKTGRIKTSTHSLVVWLLEERCSSSFSNSSMLLMFPFSRTGLRSSSAKSQRAHTFWWYFLPANILSVEPNVISSTSFSPQSAVMVPMQDTTSIRMCIPPSNTTILPNSSGWWKDMSTIILKIAASAVMTRISWFALRVTSNPLWYMSKQ